MRKTLTLLVASMALTAAIGAPAWSAMDARTNEESRPVSLPVQSAVQVLPVILASDDEEDDDHVDREISRRGHGDEDDDCEENDECRGGARNPAPAGTAAPPSNGLFGNGTPPQGQVN